MIRLVVVPAQRSLQIANLVYKCETNSNWLYRKWKKRVKTEIEAKKKLGEEKRGKQEKNYEIKFDLMKYVIYRGAFTNFACLFRLPKWCLGIGFLLLH